MPQDEPLHCTLIREMFMVSQKLLVPESPKIVCMFTLSSEHVENDRDEVSCACKQYQRYNNGKNSEFSQILLRRTTFLPFLAIKKTMLHIRDDGSQQTVMQ